MEFFIGIVRRFSKSWVAIFVQQLNRIDPTYAELLLAPIKDR